MRFGPALFATLTLAACSPPPEPGAQSASRATGGFPAPDRPVSGIVSSNWTSGPNRDVADESGQLIRALGIKPGMAVADIGAGSGYHTLRLSPAVGPKGVVYAEDIVATYLSGLKREAERRNLTNVRIVVGTPDDPGLATASVDRVVMVHMYHEIANPYGLLWRLAPALRPSGQVGVLDLDRATGSHGAPPALVKCEFEAVGYRHVQTLTLQGGVGYLAIFEPPKSRPEPNDIKACKA